MARRRGQREGHLRKKSGSWLLEWREYVPGEDKPRRRAEVIAKCAGPEAVTRREAERIAWENHLSLIDKQAVRPSSTMNFQLFVESKFQVQVVEKRKPSTKKHYRYILGNFVLPALGHRRICDISRDDVETLVAKALKNYSVQLAVHIKNAVSRIFKHAKALRVYGDENPAAGVDCGELVHNRRSTFSWENAMRALERLSSPYREMGWLSIETSANAAELCGLVRSWTNLGPDIKVVHGEVLPPYSIGIRENWYEGQRGSLKRGKRRRNCPITPEMARDLQTVIEKSRFQGDEYPVFCSRTGHPVDQHNVSNRIFKPLSVRLGFPINWHGFRRAHSTFAGQIAGVSVEDRRLTMGHSDADMTLYYSIEDIERRRAIPDQIRKQLLHATRLRLVKGEGA